MQIKARDRTAKGIKLIMDANKYLCFLLQISELVLI